MPLPVDRFVRVQVAGVQEAGIDLDDPAEAPGLDHLRRSAARPERKGTPRSSARKPPGARAAQARIASLAAQVDAERLFAHQVLTGLDGRAVDLSVQVVRHGDSRPPRPRGWPAAPRSRRDLRDRRENAP